MALDWSNERYVRLYARLTPDMAAWAWQAKAVWPWVLVCADGAGIIETAKGARGVAAVLAGGGFPLDVVEAGLVELVADGCLEVRPDGRGYVVRNYVEAQTATMTDSARKARQRDRERAERARCGAQDAGTSPADHGHAESRQVTPGHAESHGDRSVTPDVTPSRTEPNRSSLPPAREAPAQAPVSEQGPAPAQAPAVATAEPSLRELLDHAIDRLNQARAAVDPSAPPLPLVQGKPGNDLLDHLRPLPADRRKPALDHAIDVMVAELRREGRPVDDYRLGMLAGDRSWHRWSAGTVAGAQAAKGSRPAARGDPSSGAAPPAATHGTGTIDPKTVRPRKP